MEKLKNDLQASQAGQDTPPRQAAQLGNLLNDLFGRMAALGAKDTPVLGLPTGFGELDEMIGGLEAGDLIAVKGTRGVGVTAFFLNIALNVARITDRPVILFSQRQTAQQLVRRFLSAETQVSIHKMERGRLSPQEWAALDAGSQSLSKRDIRIYDADASVDETVAFCETIENPALIIVDGLPSGEQTGEQPVDQLLSLKRLAQSRQTAVLCECWLREPLDYAAGHVDKVLWLNRASAWQPYGSDSKAFCRVERNIYGRNGEAELCWHAETLTFSPFPRAGEGNLPPEE